MIYKNTTDLNDKLIHKMIAFACTRWRQLTSGDFNRIPKSLHNKFFKKHIREFTITNREENYSGVHYYLGTNIGSEIKCRIGKKYRGKWIQFGICNEKPEDYIKRNFLNYEREVIAMHVIAHEVGHGCIHHNECHSNRKPSRHYGKSKGGDEEYIDRIAEKITQEFYEQGRHPYISESNLKKILSLKLNTNRLKDTNNDWKEYKNQG